MSEHELILRHASNWARERQRVCDTALLEQALDLRAFHDGDAANFWPTGSVEHLMLVRWPASGAEAPDAERLADSLDTFVRFLRVTGRMASGSGDPRVLAKEAHRAAPKMAAACNDPAHFGPTKSLLAFGRDVGFAVDDAASPEELQSTLEQVVAAWNALPDDERRARMPLPSDRIAGRGQRAFERFSDLLDDDPADTLDDLQIDRGDPARAAEQARESRFVQSCLRLAEWVGPRKEVTNSGVLRVADAKRAYAELELWRWQHEVAQLGLVGRQGAPSREFHWKRAGDALPLERLWFAAQQAGLVDTARTVVRDARVRPEDDDEWVGLALALTFSLWVIAESSYERTIVPVLALLGGAILGGVVTDEQIREQWAQHPQNAWRIGHWESPSPETASMCARMSDQQVELSLHFFDDAAIWVREDDAYRLTDFGKEFAVMVFDYLDSRDGVDADA